MAIKNIEEVRDRLIDATEDVITMRGIAGLTLDAVARQAGISKGGLLHHFPTKEKLVDALFERTVFRWKTSIKQAVANETPGPGRLSRAVLQLSLADLSVWNERCRRNSAALVTLLVQRPVIDSPLHQFYRDLIRNLQRDGLPAGTGELVLAAIDGIWVHWITGVLKVDEDRVKRIRGLLERILKVKRKKKTTKRVALSGAKRVSKKKSMPKARRRKLERV